MVGRYEPIRFSYHFEEAIEYKTGTGQENYIVSRALKFTKKTSRAPKLAKIFDCSASLGDDDDDDAVRLPIALKLKVAHICF